MTEKDLMACNHSANCRCRSHNFHFAILFSKSACSTQKINSIRPIDFDTAQQHWIPSSARSWKLDIAATLSLTFAKSNS
jgi:hypothetical protein